MNSATIIIVTEHRKLKIIQVVQAVKLKCKPISFKIVIIFFFFCYH